MRVRVAVVVPLLGALLAACSSTPKPPDVPVMLMPPSGQVPFLETLAKGVQIYECVPKQGQAGVYEWVLRAPEATLTDWSGRVLGKHYAGPVWEATGDGSKVMGSVKSRADAPVAGAIPWLLLSTKSVGGTGYFADVTSIQRVATHGGVAPAGDCAKTGMQARVEYTADYYFFNAR